MPRAVSSFTLATTVGAGTALAIFGVLALVGAGHAETLPAKPLPVMVALQTQAPVLPAASQRDVQPAVTQDRSGRSVRVVYPGPYAQR